MKKKLVYLSILCFGAGFYNVVQAEDAFPQRGNVRNRIDFFNQRIERVQPPAEALAPRVRPVDRVIPHRLPVVGADMAAADQPILEMHPIADENAPIGQINVGVFRTIIRNAVRDVLSEQSPINETILNAIVNVAAQGVAGEHCHQMDLLAAEARVVMLRMQDAHRHEMAAAEAECTEAERQRDQAEKIITLRGILLHIPVTDKTPITLRAANLIEQDILERHNKVEELYRRFLPYSELFGRTDLDVVATSDDLNSVKRYIDETSETAILGHFGRFSFVEDSDFNGKSMGTPLYEAKKRLEDQIARFSREGVATTRAKAKLDQIFQRYREADDTVSMSRNDAPFWGHQACEISYFKNGTTLGHAHQEFGGGWWGGATGIFGNIPAGKGRGVPVYDHWNNAVIKRNGELRTTIEAIKNRAKELFFFEADPTSELHKVYRLGHSIPPLCIVFPSASFNRLVDQVNRFFIEGLQDAH